MNDEHERSFNGSEETFEESKADVRATLIQLSHNLVDLGPEFVEEKWGLKNDHRQIFGFSYNPRQLIGKGLVFLCLALVVVVIGILGGVVYGVWDKV